MFRKLLQELFSLFEELGVSYLSGGWLYTGIKAMVASRAPEEWQTYDNHEQEWRFVEFDDRRGSWDLFRRAIFCRPTYENRSG